MDNARLLPVALANLRASAGFLEKLLPLCEQAAAVSKSAGTSHQADEQTVLAVSLLAAITESLLMEIEHCQQHGGSFSARQVIAAAVGQSSDSSPPDENADRLRMRVITDLCLQQGDIYRKRALLLSTEISSLRKTVADICAELAATRNILNK